jgi:hypothetical protein
MNRLSLHLLVAATAALSISTAHAAGCPWLGEGVPYNAASDEAAPAESGTTVAAEGDYVFSEANFPPAAINEPADSAPILASFDPLEAP